MTNQAKDCLFCRIAAGEITPQIVRETDRTIAFNDIEPQAPVHVLVIPREHHPSIGSLATADPELAGLLMAEAAAVAEELGLVDFRLVTNTGAQAGQSVFHVHLHVLGGRPMRWPPG